ncbi:MAG: hypothetical protein U0169_04595 [Polyangiaceae bacterium]
MRRLPTIFVSALGLLWSSAVFAAPTVSVALQVDPSCNGTSTGRVELNVTGGTAPYTFLWSNGQTSSTIANLAAGTYQVTVTDAAAESAQLPGSGVTLTEPSAIVPVVTTTPASCPQDADGSARVATTGGTGAYSYRWSNGATAQAVMNLVPGTYAVFVADANGCEVRSEGRVTGPAALDPRGMTTPDSRAAGCTGSASVDPTGGKAPYTVSWSPSGATTSAIVDVCGPTATATVTDACGTQATYNAPLGGPNSDLSISASGPTMAVAAGSTFTVAISAGATATAPNAEVKGTLPTGTTFESMTAPGGWSCTTPAVGAAGSFSCVATSFAAGAANFQLGLRVDPSAPSGTLAVAVSIAGDVVDGMTTNDSSTVNVDVTAAPDAGSDGGATSDGSVDSGATTDGSTGVDGSATTDGGTGADGSVGDAGSADATVGDASVADGAVPRDSGTTGASDAAARNDAASSDAGASSDAAASGDGSTDGTDPSTGCSCRVVNGADVGERPGLFLLGLAAIAAFVARRRSKASTGR